MQKLHIPLNIQRFATHLNTWDTYCFRSGTSTFSTSNDDFHGRIKVYLESQNIADNTSYIKIEHYFVIKRVDGNWGGSQSAYSRYRANQGSQGGSYQTVTGSISTAGYSKGTVFTRLVGTTYHKVTHNSDGSGRLYVNGEVNIVDWNARTSSFNVALPTIARGTTINSFTVAKRDLTSLTVNWGTAHNVDRVQYKIGSGAWTNGETSINKASGSFNITGLNPNTSYSIAIKVRRTDTQVETVSGAKSQTTYDIARITSTSPSNNIEMGDNVSVNFTNPSGAAMQVGIYSKYTGSPQVAIAAYRDYAGASPYVFTLTQEEKEIMYDLALSNPIQTFQIYINNLNNTYRMAVDRTFKITENASSKPLFTTWTYKDTNAETVALTGDNQKIIKGYSNVEAKILKADKMVTQKKAIPSHYTFTIGGKSEVIPFVDAEIKKTINKVDNIAMSLTAVDSRGFTKKLDKDLGNNFIEYTRPVVLKSEVKRDNDVETATKLTFNGTWWGGNFGAEQNGLIAKVYYKLTSDNEYIESETINLTINGNEFSFDGYIKGDLGANGFTIDNGFDIQIRIVDKLTSDNEYNDYLPSGKPAIAIHDEGVAFGSPYDENLGGALQIDGELFAEWEEI